MNENEIINRIKNLYPDALLELSGEDCSFEMYIVSDDFNGLSIIQRQQSILGLFKEELAKGTLHALSVKAKTPAEMENTSSLVQISL